MLYNQNQKQPPVLAAIVLLLPNEIQIKSTFNTFYTQIFKAKVLTVHNHTEDKRVGALTFTTDKFYECKKTMANA